MKHLSIVLCLFFFVSVVKADNETKKEQSAASLPENCEILDKVEAETCEKQKKEIERITVHGRFIGIEVPEVTGRSFLNKSLIDSVAKTNGDINDIIALLPGVQTSESALNISNIGEVSAQEISISGAKPWQTGFYLDGMNYNNRIDPGAAQRVQSSQNEVNGGVQSMNINSQIVDSIEVFDNNIPAEFGEFSGGVVKATTSNPLEEKNTLILGYRGTQSDWGEFKLIKPEVFTEDTNTDITLPQVFEKNSYDILLINKINAHHGLMINLNYLESTISDISLGESINQQRVNGNYLIKYQYKNGWVDDLSVKLLYAPYQSNNFLQDVLNSKYELQGGNQGFSTRLKHSFDLTDWVSEVDINQSDSSRTAPPHYYIWQQAKGKEWGAYASFETNNSLEGGYGNLDNTQTNYSWKNTFQFNTATVGSSSHSILAGMELQHQTIVRHRPEDHYFYNFPLQYSVSPGSSGLNCSGYLLDCVERELEVSIDELEAQLGGDLDISNIEHFLAYSDNILVTPQYFQGRTVFPSEHISVALTKMAAFVTDNIEYNQWNINWGLRYSYDDFFANHNISPRLSVGYDLFDDGDSLLIAGLNRYYDAGLLSYRINEQQEFAKVQYRPIQNGYLQGWIDSSATDNYKYLYQDLATPFNDELVMGWKQATQWFGNFSIKLIKRWQKDQLARNPDSVTQDDGYKYISMNNEGTGNSTRVSLSWNAQYKNHSFWFNASHLKAYESNSSYEIEVTEAPIEEFVYLDGEVVNYNVLDLVKTNFARPVNLSVGWTANWFNNFNTTLTATHQQESKNITQYGYESTAEVNSACSQCEVSYLSLPKYITNHIPERTLLSLNTRWSWNLYKKNRLELRLDVSNLLNARTYTVSSLNYGFEAGRQFWLGLSYHY